MKNFSIVTAFIVGTVALLVGMAAVNGFILSYMWEWFITPFGLPSIGILHAIGIAVLVSMLTYQGSPDREEGKGLERLMVGFLAKIVAFGIAFLVSFGVAA